MGFEEDHHPHNKKDLTKSEVFYRIGAGDGIRTHDINLGKVALYP